TKDRIALAVVADGGVAAVKRCPPARVPEVLVGRVDIPGRGETELCRRAASRAGDSAAIDCVAHDTEALVLTLDLAPIGVGRLEDITECALRVIHLRLEVVALTDHRSVQLDTGTNGKTQFIIGVTFGRAQRGVIDTVDLMQGAHDLGRTPSLIDAQVGHNVGGLEASIATGERSSARRNVSENSAGTE